MGPVVTTRHKDRNRKWRRVIDRIKACPPDKFDMGSWIRILGPKSEMESAFVCYTREIPSSLYTDTSCGTVCCFGGHAVLELGHPLNGEQDNRGVEQEACKLLDIPHLTWGHSAEIFFSHRWLNRRISKDYEQAGLLFSTTDPERNLEARARRKGLAIKYFEWYLEYELPAVPFYTE